ncbi:MAG: biotin-dependent carboxyltransferase [Deltaproteobacteria bacterium]|nr:biotin-dependent carboxyltransferase [Deltaproteobacteria bacterium]
MAIEVLKPGLATTVQDAGREGYYHLGIPLSGALDQYSFRAANLLVGNDENAAVLECTLLGPELAFQQEAIVAVAGADLQPKLNGAPMPAHESFPVKKGDVLSFAFLKAGARAYLAVAGGIDVPVVLGSRSTYGLGAFGGFTGRGLKPGDLLPVGKPGPGARGGRSLAAALRPVLRREVELRVMPGLYYHRITEQSARDFFEDVWSVAPEADRIGYRYRHGRPLRWKERKQPFGAGSDPSNIVDAGYPFGSIQVPGGLEPIVLHRDAVSGGGYAMIGTVISADMDVIAQMQPNNKARFVSVDMEQALQARADYRARTDALRAALSS